MKTIDLKLKYLNLKKDISFKELTTNFEFSAMLFILAVAKDSDFLYELCTFFK